MAKDIEYQINGNNYTVSIEGSPILQFGEDEVLSKVDSDITFGQPWYDEGFTEVDLLNENEFSDLKTGLITSIEDIIKKELSIVPENFNLENYHYFVKDDASHFKIVSKTRDLFEEDFKFPITQLISRLGDKLGFNLTDVDPSNKKKLHIIVRINRPQSNDYNPPHKDIYEGVDSDSNIPQFVNFWIPIAGVTNKSSLPLAPKSHKINEKLINRTFDGGMMEGNKYRVRMIKSWGGDNSFIRSNVQSGQVLIFSSHLIHGLAINNEEDKTRVALEFRLFKDNA
ncbi:phytanoyl-CoA dioxygenase family protein [uncultured Arcticibacterium sp.]|uniref:phytanoyl-CoA dioxygenase family protein n=1 Tax=uncultured Arcticibacterium sp. TaxID=2173042 RepID=UPI0030F9C90B